MATNCKSQSCLNENHFFDQNKVYVIHIIMPLHQRLLMHTYTQRLY